MKVGFEHGFLLPNASQIRCEEPMVKEMKTMFKSNLHSQIKYLTSSFDCESPTI